MAISERRAGSERPIIIATYIVAAISIAVMAFPQAAAAQQAGGSGPRGPEPALNSPLGNVPAGPPDPPQCFHRTIDNRRSFAGDDHVTVWLSVHRPATAAIQINASANGPDTGTLAIALLSNGVPVANSQESRGQNIIDAHAGTLVQLFPGRQYTFTARATVSRQKRLDLLNLNVSVGKGCP